ncbi:unnamed protein product [Prorocentrum cordatum]|uniref:Uncharacterized protein n=1 Tax=Prorocentrum cordatum TaxID=2364126 RepID=A0ABN9PW27_9DINO|nr:unnamed protein product [Polarella glacialis]
MPGSLSPKAAGLRRAEEAARGALLAAHAAAGLAAEHSRDGVRLLRAAEGLLRAAVAGLRSPAAEPPAPVPGAAAAPARRRRRRGRGGRGGGAAGPGDGADEDRAGGGEAVGDHVMEDATGGGRRQRRRRRPQPAPVGLPLADVAAGPAAGQDAFEDELNDEWADGLTVLPGRRGPGRPPALAPDVRARLCRGPLAGFEVTVVAVGERSASVRFDTDDPAAELMDVRLDFLEALPLAGAGGGGSGGR